MHRSSWSDWDFPFSATQPKAKTHGNLKMFLYDNFSNVVKFEAYFVFSENCFDTIRRKKKQIVQDF